MSAKRIFSFLPKIGAIRLTNGQELEKSFVLAGEHCLEWNFANKSEMIESISLLSKAIRPLPEIIVTNATGDLNSLIDFCQIEQSDLNSACKTYNTLVDDNQRVIGFFQVTNNSNLDKEGAGKGLANLEMMLFSVFSLLSVYSIVSLLLFSIGSAKAGYTPIVLYHGLGDSCCSGNMMRIIGKLQEALPGVFIHSVRIGKTPEDDRKRSLIDNMNRQIEEVCQQLAQIPELSNGFNAIGISQGGQFLRAYVQRCNSPPVRKLITLGSQHQGVMALPGCKESSSLVHSTSSANRSWFDRTPFGALMTLIRELIQEDPDCAWWKQLLKMGVYSPIVRSQVVQAQYFKDPANMQDYLDHNQFLVDVNNEIGERNEEYAARMSSLSGLYLYMFEGDTVVVPKESGWFGVFDPTAGRIKFLSEQPMYTENRLGLRTLAERDAIFFRKLPGEHLKLSNEFLTGELADILRS